MFSNPFKRKNNSNHVNQECKMQSQKQVDLITQTAQTQTFMEQADDTLEAVVTVAQMAADPGNYSVRMVNMLNDNQIASLNLFAKTCDELYDESDERSLALGKKQVMDKFAALQKEDKRAYELATPHYKFMIEALNGHRNLRIKGNRVNESVKPLFENNPKKINEAYSKIIHSKQNFDHRQNTFKDPNVSKELAAKQQSELREYHNDPTYKSNADSKPYNMPNQTHFYFTESGKNSKFVNEEAVAQKNEEEKCLNDVLMGEPDTKDIYDEIESKTNFMNAVLKASKSAPVGHIKEPICVEILKPDKKQRATQDKNLIIIRPCNPWNNCVLKVYDIKKLELNVKKVKKAEQEHIKARSKLGDKKGLGYRSIEQQEAQMDLD